MEEGPLDKAELDEVPVETAPQLDESLELSRLEGKKTRDVFCPVCSKVLPERDASRCPHCGADIARAKQVIKMSDEIVAGIEGALRQGKLDVAEEGLTQLDKINLGYQPRARFLRAKLCFLEKDFAKAIMMANSVIDEVEVDETLKKEIDAELSIWQAELLRKIESQEHYNFALSRIRDGYFEEARDHLMKAIRLAPHLDDNFRLLAKVCMKLRDYENARYYIERALLIDEHDPESKELLARFRQEEREELLRLSKKRTTLYVISVPILLLIAILVTFLISTR